MEITLKKQKMPRRQVKSISSYSFLVFAVRIKIKRGTGRVLPCQH